MLLPKRVKHRKQHRGRMTGRAMRGNRIAHGDFGLVASNVAVKFGFKFSRINRLLQNLLKLVWVLVKVLRSTG